MFYIEEKYKYHKESYRIIDAGRENGLEVNAHKTSRAYIVISRHQTAGQNHVTVANNTFKSVARFKCLGTTVTK
jgi:hypothetical protein